MIVINVTDVPVALRGDLTKWLLEINTGVFVGKLSARVRDEVWERVVSYIKNGRATMVYSTNNEQGMDFRVHNTTWEPIDFDGLKLILKPSPSRIKKLGSIRQGFSKAATFHKLRSIQNSTTLETKDVSKADITPGNPTVETKKLKITEEPAYVAIDIETNGLNPKEHEITELGAVKIKGGIVTETYQTLVKTEKPIPKEIVDLTGITNEMLAQDGKELADAMEGFLAFVDELPVICHNAAFDYSFLQDACRKCNEAIFKNKCIDTLALAKRYIKGVANYRLATLAEHLGLDQNLAHRSRNDCETTIAVYQKILEKVNETDKSSGQGSWNLGKN
jgi:CRISPR-associated protein Cas2